MENYKPNSHKSKENKGTGEDRKKLEKVVSGDVITKKKSGASKFINIFVSEDASSVKSYLWTDVFVPTVRRLAGDIIKDTADILFGNGVGRNGSRDRYGGNYISYNKFSDRRDDRRYDDRYESRGFEYDDIILTTKGDAEDVLMQLDALIERYGQATVADLFDLVGKSGPYTNNKYGWTNLRNAHSVRVREGHLLKLPRALPID